MFSDFESTSKSLWDFLKYQLWVIYMIFLYFLHFSVKISILKFKDHSKRPPIPMEVSVQT